MNCLLAVFGNLGIGVRNIDGRFDPDFCKVAWRDKLWYLKVSALDIKVTSWELYPSVVGRLRHKTALDSSWLFDSKLSFRFAEKIILVLPFVTVTSYLAYYLQFWVLYCTKGINSQNMIKMVNNICNCCNKYVRGGFIKFSSMRSFLSGSKFSRGKYMWGL